MRGERSEQRGEGQANEAMQPRNEQAVRMAGNAQLLAATAARGTGLHRQAGARRKGAQVEAGVAAGLGGTFAEAP